MNSADALTDKAARLVAVVRRQFGLPGFPAPLIRLLADGEPVSVEVVAVSGGWTVDELRAELDRHPGTDWDTEGRIVGFGLTLRPTPHTFAFDDRTVYAFCASDALMFPLVLGRPGVVESTCPVTGTLVRVRITPDRVLSVDPAEAVVSTIRPDYAVTDIRTQICDLGNFFANP
jgi:alkylmercury lyase